MRVRTRLTVLVAALAAAFFVVAPATASAPPQFVKTLVGPGLADMYPVDIASTGSSYLVLDAGRYRVVEVDRGTGQIVDQFGGHQGKSTTRIGAARAIALDEAGNVYIADTASNRVVKLDANLAYATAWGTRGSGNGQFLQDYGVAVGPRSGSEVVYVTDGAPGRVQVFSKTGVWIDSFGQGVINKPRQLTVDPATEFV
jgi:hypothetical protein